jgi:hypothetical protein
MLSRGWRKIVAVLTSLSAFAVLDRIVSLVFARPTDVEMEPIARPHDAETTEHELTGAIQTKAGMEITPPEASMPIGNRVFWTEPQDLRYYGGGDSSWGMRGSPLVLILGAGPNVPT